MTDPTGIGRSTAAEIIEPTGVAAGDTPSASTRRYLPGAVEKADQNKGCWPATPDDDEHYTCAVALR